MRLWHLLFAVCASAFALSLSRNLFGLVTVLVFAITLGEVVFGTTAILFLFRTVGAFASADRIGAHLEALAATALVLLIATIVMVGWLFVGIRLVSVAVERAIYY